MAKKPVNWLEYDGGDQILPFHVVKEKYAGQKDVISFSTGIPKLDGYLNGGIMLGELYTVTGPTKQGKTLLLQTITKNLEPQGANPLWFQFEVPQRQFLNQFPQLPTGFMPSELVPNSLSWLAERVLESKAKFFSQIIFVDHLHYLFDMARSRNPSLEIGTLVRGLKRIAVTMDVVIFLACHTTKISKETKSKDLDYSILRDSGIISQESDSVFIITRVDSDASDNLAQMKIEFHRRTGVRKKVVPLVKIRGWLEELEEERS